MASPKRDKMLAVGGKALDSSDAVVDITATLKQMGIDVTTIAGAGAGGDATEAKQDDIITALASPAQAGEAAAATGALATEAGGNLAAVKTNLDPLLVAGGGGYVRQDSTATIAKETGGNLATVKTNLDPLITAAGGGYVRQDSTATMAKETGGNLATVKTNLDPLIVAGGGGYVRQDSTATIAKESGGNLDDISADTSKIVDAKTTAHTQPTAGATTNVLLASNADRKSALLQNISDEDVWIKIDAAAVLSQGILLPALSTEGVPGTFEMSAAFGNLDTSAINGISVSGSKVVLVTEWD